MKPNDRFFTASDGTRIAYGVAGRGTPLILCNGLMTTSNFWARLWPMWIERYTVVTWDYPGHGRSSPACTDRIAGIEAQPAILAGILDALGIERGAHLGFSVGCQVALEMYRQFPTRVSAVAALLGTASHAIRSTSMAVPAPLLSRFFERTPDPLFAPGFRTLARFANTRVGFELGRKLSLIGSSTPAEMAGVLDHFRRLDPNSMRAMARSAEAHSAADVLPRLRVPFLVVSGARDVFAPADRIGAEMHAMAPGSEFVRLPHATHTGLLDHASEIFEAVERLLSGGRAAAA